MAKCHNEGGGGVWGRGRHIADAIAVRYRIMYAAASRRDVRGSSNKACNENFRIADNYLSPRRGKGGAQWGRGSERGRGRGSYRAWQCDICRRAANNKKKT